MPGSTLQYCGLMTLATPLWAGTAARLGWRFMRNPARYCRRVDRRLMTFPDPVEGMAHRTVDNGGVKLHVATHGLGAGKPLMLFVHGFPETWASWRHQLKEFAGQYELAAMDLRGFGDSDAPVGVRHYTVDRLASDVAAVVKALGHTHCILVAHDWGGAVAWHTAVLHPEVVSRLVVLCCPHPAAYTDPERMDGTAVASIAYMLNFHARGLTEAWLRHNDFWEVERVFTERASGGAHRPGTFSPEDLHRTKAALGRPGRLTAGLSLYRAVLASATKWDIPATYRAQYTPVAAPTLLMWADGDRFPRQMFMRNEKHVPELTTLCLKDCSHWAPQDRFKEVNANIRAWLEGKLPADGTSASRPGTAGRASNRGSMIVVRASATSGGATPRSASPRPGTPRLVARQE